MEPDALWKWLEGEHPESIEYPFGANVASLIIFDLDDEHIVGFVETLIPLESWQQTDADLSPAGGTRRGSLQIEGPAITGLAVDLS